MAEVFDGTPAIVSVTIADQEGKQVQYHVAGQDLDKIAESIREALSAIPAAEQQPKAKKPRKKRRTKAEMATGTRDAYEKALAASRAASEDASAADGESAPERNRAPRNKKERIATADAGKAWP